MRPRLLFDALSLLSLLIVLVSCGSSGTGGSITVSAFSTRNNPVSHTAMAVRVNHSELDSNTLGTIFEEAASDILPIQGVSTTPVHLSIYDSENAIWEASPGSYSRYQCSGVITVDENIIKAGQQLSPTSKAFRILGGKYSVIAGCGLTLNLEALSNKAREIAVSESQNIEQPEPTPVSTPSPKTLGYSYGEFMNFLSNLFPNMEYQPLADGRDRLLGHTASGEALLELIGDTDDLSQVSVMITLPVDDPLNLLENLLILDRFIKNAVPEWGDGSDWVIENFERVVLGRDKDISTSKFGRRVTLQYLEALDLVMLNVSPE